MGDVVRSVPVYDFAIGRGVKGSACSQHSNAFEQVRFALGVLPVKQKETSPQRKVKVPVIAEFIQRKVRKIHSMSQVVPGSKGIRRGSGVRVSAFLSWPIWPAYLAYLAYLAYPHPHQRLLA